MQGTAEQFGNDFVVIRQCLRKIPCPKLDSHIRQSPSSPLPGAPSQTPPLGAGGCGRGAGLALAAGSEREVGAGGAVAVGRAGG